MRQLRLLRITPAYAGNTTILRSMDRNIWDHPRLRGEYEQKSQGERLAKGSPPACAGNTIEIIQFRMKKKTGSPPLARGIPNGHIPATPLGRIIPACAGNTHSCFHGKAILWDHPRLRGEYTVCGTIEENAMGSPPLARGIPCDFEHKIMCIGITPAYAGNTPFSALSLLPSRDHPRLRGEYSIISSAIWLG